MEQQNTPKFHRNMKLRLKFVQKNGLDKDFELNMPC